MKKQKITKEFLQKIGFTYCDPETGQLYKGDYKQTYNKVWARKKWGKDKYYWVFSYYDADYYAEQMVKFKAGKLKSKPTGVRLMLVHRAVWAWFKGETPDDMDVCHIEDDVDDNCIDHLTIMSHGDNIRARKVQTGGNPKWLKNN